MHRLYIIILCLTPSMVHAMSIFDAAEDYYQRRIFCAKTVKEAQKCINKGALNKLSDEDECRLFNEVTEPDRESGLIRLYKGHGLDCLKRCPSWGYTALMLLAMSPPHKHDVIEKAELFLQGLSYEQQCNFIKCRTDHRDTVLDFINRVMSSSDKTICRLYNIVNPQSDIPHVLQQLTALRNLLQGVLERPSCCAICFDPLDAVYKTINDLKVHPTCKDWAEQNSKGL